MLLGFVHLFLPIMIPLVVIIVIVAAVMNEDKNARGLRKCMNTSCGRMNRPEAKYCSQCGALLG